MSDFAENGGTEDEESLADTEAELVEISKGLDDEESLADTEAETTSLEEADRMEDN